jgi:hypothetical protein
LIIRPRRVAFFTSAPLQHWVFQLQLVMDAYS